MVNVRRETFDTIMRGDADELRVISRLRRGHRPVIGAVGRLIAQCSPGHFDDLAHLVRRVGLADCR